MQEDVELKEYTPAIRIKAGELVCDADYYNKVPGASLWYTPTQGEERKTKVRMQQVVAANLKLTPISPSNKLPPGMSKKNKTAATKLNAQRLDPAEHEKMLDDIHRREARLLTTINRLKSLTDVTCKKNNSLLLLPTEVSLLTGC